MHPRGTKRAAYGGGCSRSGRPDVFGLRFLQQFWLTMSGGQTVTTIRLSAGPTDRASRAIANEEHVPLDGGMLDAGAHL